MSLPKKKQKKKKAPVGVSSCACDLLTMCKLLNTDIVHFSNGQRSVPRGAQISVGPQTGTDNVPW